MATFWLKALSSATSTLRLALAPYPAHGAVDSEGGELRAQARLRLWMPWVGVAPTWQAHVFSAAYALSAFFVLCCAAI